MPGNLMVTHCAGRCRQMQGSLTASGSLWRGFPGLGRRPSPPHPLVALEQIFSQSRGPFKPLPPQQESWGAVILLAVSSPKAGLSWAPQPFLLLLTAPALRSTIPAPLHSGPELSAGNQRTRDRVTEWPQTEPHTGTGLLMLWKSFQSMATAVGDKHIWARGAATCTAAPGLSRSVAHWAVCVSFLQVGALISRAGSQPP